MEAAEIMELDFCFSESTCYEKAKPFFPSNCIISIRKYQGWITIIEDNDNIQLFSMVLLSKAVDKLWLTNCTLGSNTVAVRKISIF